MDVHCVTFPEDVDLIYGSVSDILYTKFIHKIECSIDFISEQTLSDCISLALPFSVLGKHGQDTFLVASS